MPMVDIDWLKDHVEVPEGLTYEQLAKDLVKVGLEEEEIHTSQVTGPIVVGYVVDATPEPQKNGKIINWCHVDVGDEYNETDENGNKVPRGIICGAPNMAAGEKVVVTLPGACCQAISRSNRARPTAISPTACAPPSASLVWVITTTHHPATQVRLHPGGIRKAPAGR